MIHLSVSGEDLLSLRDLANEYQEGNRRIAGLYRTFAAEIDANAVTAEWQGVLVLTAGDAIALQVRVLERYFRERSPLESWTPLVWSRNALLDQFIRTIAGR